MANEVYTSDFDLSSFELNQYLITAADTGDTYDDPTGPWGCSGMRDKDRIKLLPAGPPPHDTTFPCWNATTLGDELNSAKLTWAYYAVAPTSPDTSAYQAIKHIYKGPDWRHDIFSPPSKFLRDISGGELRKEGYLSRVHYETGSLLRFVEDRYGLPSLGISDMRAASPATDCLDFKQRTRKFVPIR